MSGLQPDMLRSMARFVLGGAVLSIDELEKQIMMWEQETTRELAERHQHFLSDSTASATNPPPVEMTPETMRYAMIGLFFDVHHRMQQGMQQMEAMGERINEVTAPALTMLEKNELLAPARDQFEMLVQRGESEMSRLVEMGRAEEEHSRMLLGHAISISADSTISHVIENPRVEQIVHKQSVGLVTEIVEEIRERGISLDAYLERLVRYFFNRPSREQMPEPVIDFELPRAHMRANDP